MTQNQPKDFVYNPSEPISAEICPIFADVVGSDRITAFTRPVFYRNRSDNWAFSLGLKGRAQARGRVDGSEIYHIHDPCFHLFGNMYASCKLLYKHPASWPWFHVLSEGIRHAVAHEQLWC